MAGQLRRDPVRERALEGLAGVDPKGRKVGEVEALELIVTENDQHVGRSGGQPGPERGEGQRDPGGLRAVRRQVVHRHVGA
jgi:hypothetical protein